MYISDLELISTFVVLGKYILWEKEKALDLLLGKNAHSRKFHMQLFEVHGPVRLSCSKDRVCLESLKKIFVLVCWALSLLKREHFEGKGDPHCVGLIHLCLTDQLFRRETLCPRGYRKLYCPFSFQIGSCILLKVNKCEPGKVCLVSDADFRTWEWSLCLAKMSSLRSIWANMFSALDLAFALW